MKDFMEQWKAFRFDNDHEKPNEYVRMQNTDKSTVNRDAARQVMWEISQRDLDQISNYLGRVPPDRLSFNSIFGDKYRIMIPFDTPADIDKDTPFGMMMALFKGANAVPDFSTGTVTQQIYIPQIDQTRERKSRIGKWLNKLLHEYNKYTKIAREYGDKREEWNKARLDDTRDEDEERLYNELSAISQKQSQTRDKFTKDFGNVHRISTSDIEEVIDFWNHKSEYYRQNPEAAEGEKDVYSIIISRAPIDVIRMSDFANIHSCHSPGSDYFKCAVAEAKGHGLVAYVVKNEEIRQAEEKGFDLQDDEIFNDRSRMKEGIQPVTRVRLRKFTYKSPYDGTQKEMAVPEDNLYGKDFPKFIPTVREWARKVQPEVQKIIETGDFPDWNTYTRYGGSYGDESDDFLLNNLLDPSDNIEPYDDGDVEHDVEDEDNLYDEYVERAQELQNYADRSMKNASVYHEVEEDWDGEGTPYVSFHGGLAVNFKSNEMLSIPSWRDRDVSRAIESALSDHNIYMVEEVEFNEWGGNFSVEIRAGSGEYGIDPDGFESFIDDIESELEGNYEEIQLIVKKALQAWGYMEPGQYYSWATELEDLEDEAFEHFDVNIESEYVDIEVKEPLSIDTTEYIRPFAMLMKKKDETDDSAAQRALIAIQSASYNRAFNSRIIKQVVTAANQALLRQLNLPGMDTQQEIEDIIAPQGFQMNTIISPSGILDLRLNVVLEPDDEDEEVIVAKSFIEWMDKNYYKLLKAMEVVFHKTMQSELERLRDTKDRYQKSLGEVEQQISQARQMVQEMEPYQKEMHRKHPKWKKNLIGKGGNKYKAAPFKLKVSMKRSKSAPPGAGG